MPRYARLQVPGAVVHSISRFVNHSFRIVSPEDLAIVLDALSRALERSDWKLFGFALMSSHLHLVLQAGEEGACRFLSSLHTRIAKRLNQRQRMFGPVLAERATTILVRPERAGALLAYVHNNPVRAGIVLDPAATNRTSHRAYVGLEAAPCWLHVAEGLALAGFDSSRTGRREFQDFVLARASEPRNQDWNVAVLPAARAALRQGLGLPVEISSPALLEEEATIHVQLGLARRSPLPRWDGELADLLSAVCKHRGLPVAAVRSPSQLRVLTSARRLFFVVGHLFLRRRLGELAAAVGLATCTASRMLDRIAEIHDEARALAEHVRERNASDKRR
jgi:hypothetical protein